MTRLSKKEIVNGLAGSNEIILAPSLNYYDNMVPLVPAIQYWRIRLHKDLCLRTVPVLGSYYKESGEPCHI